MDISCVTQRRSSGVPIKLSKVSPIIVAFAPVCRKVKGGHVTAGVLLLLLIISPSKDAFHKTSSYVV